MIRSPGHSPTAVVTECEAGFDLFVFVDVYFTIFLLTFAHKFNILFISLLP